MLMRLFVANPFSYIVKHFFHKINSKTFLILRVERVINKSNAPDLIFSDYNGIFKKP